MSDAIWLIIGAAVITVVVLLMSQPGGGITGDYRTDRGWEMYHELSRLEPRKSHPASQTPPERPRPEGE